MAKKQKEVVVLSEEQINLLPEKVQENVVFLSDNMAGSELAELNPIVIELAEIQTAVNDLVLIPADEDGKFDKDNVKTYMDAKSKIRSFNTKIKNSAKLMKAPYQAINKSLVAIEKEILALNKLNLEKAQKIFKDYDDEQARIKAEKQAQKDAELLAAVEKANEEKNALAEKSSKTETYNRIKYEKIAAMITDEATSAVNTANENTLLLLVQTIKDYNFGSMLGGSDVSILDDSVIQELQGYFETSKSNAIGILNNRIAQYKTERENIVLETKNETIQNGPVQTLDIVDAQHVVAPAPSAVPPPPPSGAPETEVGSSFALGLINKIEAYGYRNAGGFTLNDSLEWKSLKKLLN